MSFGSLPSVLGNGGGVAISVIGGTGLFADGTAAAPSISFASTPTTGFYKDSNGFGFARNGMRSFSIGGNGALYGAHSDAQYVYMPSSGAVSLVAAGTNQNITLTPSGTGVISVISGANSSNGRLELGTGPFLGYISNEASSSGALALNCTGSIAFRISGADKVTLLPNGRFLIGTTTDSGALLQIGGATSNAAGGMVFGPDTFLYREGSSAGMLKLVGTGGGGLIFQSTGSLSYYGGILISAQQRALIISQSGYDVIRTNGFAVPSELQLLTTGTIALTLDASQNANFTGYVASASNLSAGATANVLFSGRTVLGAPSDGVLKLSNNAQTDFSRLQFGGTTASFPALRRSGATIEVITADNGDWGTLNARFLGIRDTGVSWSAGSGSPEGVLTAPVGSIYSRTDSATSFYVKQTGTGNTGWVAK